MSVITNVTVTPNRLELVLRTLQRCGEMAEEDLRTLVGPPPLAATRRGDGDDDEGQEAAAGRGTDAGSPVAALVNEAKRLGLVVAMESGKLAPASGLRKAGADSVR